MVKKVLPKEKIDTEAISAKVSLKERKIFDLVAADAKQSDVPNKKPYVVLKYYQDNWQCFSDWEKSELQQWTSFLARLSEHTWRSVYESGSRCPKHGLAYTKYNIKDVKSQKAKQALDRVKNLISEDIDFFELRVNQEKLRVHGFQSQSAFFLVLLDREHAVFPS